MRQNFLLKAAALLSVFVVIFCTAYANVLSNVQAYTVGKTFYFLVSSSTHVEVSTHVAQSLGGAGYLLTEQGNEYVAYAAYHEENSANQALQNLQSVSKDEVVLLPISVETLYFKGTQQQKKSAKIVDLLSWLENQIRLLKQEERLLEKGITQQAILRLLGTQKRQFSYMQKENNNVLPAFSTLCQEAVKQIESMERDTVYLKDVRFLHCYLCQGYVDISKNFLL